VDSDREQHFRETPTTSQNDSGSCGNAYDSEVTGNTAIARVGVFGAYAEAGAADEPQASRAHTMSLALPKTPFFSSVRLAALPARTTPFICLPFVSVVSSSEILMEIIRVGT